MNGSGAQGKGCGIKDTVFKTQGDEECVCGGLWVLEEGWREGGVRGLKVKLSRSNLGSGLGQC